VFGSQILDVAIGLVFIYLLVSLIVSVVNEWISRLFSLRANTLEDGLRNMLQDPKSALGGASSLVNELYNHPLIQGLSPLRSRGRRFLPFKTPPVGTETEGLADNQVGAEGDGVAAPGAIQPPAKPPLPLGQAATRTGRPSYIDPRNFSVALLDIMAPKGVHSKNIEELKREISLLENPRLQRTLLTLVDTGEADLQSARAGIEGWFNSAMDRVSGWHKRKVQLLTLGLGLLLAALLNVDTFTVVRTLWTQPAVRDGLAKSAEQYAQRTQDDLDAQRQKIQTSLGDLRATNLPIGWILEAPPAPPAGQPVERDPRRLGDVFADWGTFLSKLLGVLLTGAAVSLGAHFWFDTLGRLRSLRSTGKPPSTDDHRRTARAGA
jgi:hypothetical protein